jgi:two-component system, OmpR family, sensor histidine kinase BaeS
VPRFALVTGVVALLGIAAINPDELIARHNIERYEETGKIDVDFLATLSDDAVPVLSWKLPEPLRSQALDGREPYDDDWLAWNLGRWRAAEYLAMD